MTTSTPTRAIHSPTYDPFNALAIHFGIRPEHRDLLTDDAPWHIHSSGWNDWNYARESATNDDTLHVALHVTDVATGLRQIEAMLTDEHLIPRDAPTGYSRWQDYTNHTIHPRLITTASRHHDQDCGAWDSLAAIDWTDLDNGVWQDQIDPVAIEPKHARHIGPDAGRFAIHVGMNPRALHRLTDDLNFDYWDGWEVWGEGFGGNGAGPTWEAVHVTFWTNDPEAMLAAIKARFTDDDLLTSTSWAEMGGNCRIVITDATDFSITDTAVEGRRTFLSVDDI